MDVGVIVDNKLTMKYVDDDEDKTRRKLKRKAMYKVQIRKAVEYMVVRIMNTVTVIRIYKLCHHHCCHPKLQ